MTDKLRTASQTHKKASNGVILPSNSAGFTFRGDIYKPIAISIASVFSICCIYSGPSFSQQLDRKELELRLTRARQFSEKVGVLDQTSSTYERELALSLRELGNVNNVIGNFYQERVKVLEKDNAGQYQPLGQAIVVLAVRSLATGLAISVSKKVSLDDLKDVLEIIQLSTEAIDRIKTNSGIEKDIIQAKELSATISSRIREISARLQQMINERNNLVSQARAIGLLPNISYDPAKGTFTVSSPNRTVNSPSQPESIGDWRLVSENDVPRLALNLVSHPVVSSVEYKCAGGKNIALFIKYKSSQKIGFGDGGDLTFLTPDAEGLVPVNEATELAQYVTRFEKSNQGNPITITFESMANDRVTRYPEVPANGFSIARSKLREACAKAPASAIAKQPPASIHSEQASATPAPISNSTPTRPVDGWGQVNQIVNNLNNSGVCRYGNFSNQGSEKLGCFNSAGTNQMGAYGIGFEINSAKGSSAARIDMQGERKLSSIVVTIPARVYVKQTPDQIRGHISPIFGAFGMPQVVDEVIEKLKAGQNVWSDNSRLQGAGYNARFLASGVNSQEFQFALIVRCSYYEDHYPYCRRRL